MAIGHTATASSKAGSVILGRVLLAGVGVLPLFASWWIGQGCVDDPCAITRVGEWRGLIVVLVVGALLLRLASSRRWAWRVGLWAATVLPALFVYRNVPARIGTPITSEAPGIASAALALIVAYLVMVVVTFLLDARERVCHRYSESPD